MTRHWQCSCGYFNHESLGACLDCGRLRNPLPPIPRRYALTELDAQAEADWQRRYGGDPDAA